jgi:hypothetical protein
MRKLVVAFAFLACAVLSQAASAEDSTSVPPGEKTTGLSVRSQLPKSLQGFGVNLISKAHAAECTEEGEICTSNEQCCSGLECTGGPPTTCTPED